MHTSDVSLSLKTSTDAAAGHPRVRGSIDWTRSVYLVVNSDGGVLLDLDNDEFVKLDPIAAEIWQCLSSGMSKAEVAESMAQKYDIDHSRAADDIDTLLQEAAARNISVERVHVGTRENVTPLTSQGQAFPWYGKSLNQSRPTPGRGAIVRAFIALLLFDLALSVRSLKFVCKLVHHWNIKTPPHEIDPTLLGKVCSAVEIACVWYPKKAVCLQRSAVTACLLKSTGIPAELVVGARVMPLSSHAWVEVSGSVVNDHPKIREVYARLVAF